MYSEWSVILCCASFGLAYFVPQPIGEHLYDPCELEEQEYISGRCLPVERCPYAEKRINVEEQWTTTCFQNGTYRLVCCPNEIHQTGPLGRAFVDAIKGNLVSNDIECRYTGEYPLVCCKREVNQSLGSRLNTDPNPNCDSSLPTSKACNACYAYSDVKENVNIICPQDTASKIANGNDAEIEEFPYMANIGHRQEKSDSDADIKWIGAGGLISPKYILTAAHLALASSKLTFALLGTTIKTDPKRGFLRNIEEVIPYKFYTSRSHEHDIALIVLFEEVPINELVKPACLPVPGVVDALTPKNVKIAGWGRSGQGMPATENLRWGTMNIGICKARSGPTNWNEDIDFCAISTSEKSADTCEGDSGSPLVTHMKDKNICGYYVLGLVSHGAICGRKWEGYYTNVQNRGYLDWVVNKVWPMI